MEYPEKKRCAENRGDITGKIDDYSETNKTRMSVKTIFKGGVRTYTYQDCGNMTINYKMIGEIKIKDNREAKSYEIKIPKQNEEITQHSIDDQNREVTDIQITIKKRHLEIIKITLK